MRHSLLIVLICITTLYACSDEVSSSMDVREQVDVVVDTIPNMCRNRTDCQPGFDCISGRCVEIKDAGADTGLDAEDAGDGGKFCTKDEECPKDYKCNLSTNTCEEIREPKVSLSESEMDFGYVQYGQSKEKCVIMVNDGNSDLEINGVDFGGGTSNAYRFKSGQEKRKTLKPNSSDYLEICVIVVPNSEEAPQGTVEVYTNADPPKVVIPLKSQYKGSADLSFVDENNQRIWPDQNTATFKVDFGLVGPGNKKSLQFRVTNMTDGDKPLLIKTLDRFASQFSGRFFDIQDDTKELTPPIIVGPSQIVGLEITYAPTQRSAKDQGNLLIETNDLDIDNDSYADNGKLMIECSGVAEFPPEIKVEPTSLEFGDVQKGVRNPPKMNVHITNTADISAGQTLKVDMELGNSQETSFSFSPSSIEIPAGDARLVEVSFAPAALDVRTNTLRITSNVPDPNLPGEFKVVEVSLRGRGLDPQFVITPSDKTIDFGEVEINKTSEKTLIISNLTSPNLGVLTVYEPELATQSSPFSWIADPPFVNGERTLNPGEQITVTVRYSPTTTGSDSNVLRLRSNDEDLPVKEISLVGIAVNYNGDPIAVARIIGATDPKKGYFEPNNTVTIDGSESQDPDLIPENRQIVEYKWSLVERPSGSSAALSSTNTVTTTITPDKIGIYKIQLEVRDNEDIWSPPDTAYIIGIGKDTLLIRTTRTVGLMGYFSNSAGSCVDCSYDLLGWYCSSEDKKDWRWEINRIIIKDTPESNLLGYYCDAIDDSNPKHSCNWNRLGVVTPKAYCKTVSIIDPNPGPFPNPMELEYNSAPTDEAENIYTVQLEYINDVSDNSTNPETTSSLAVETEFIVNGSVVKTINTTLSSKGEKRDIAEIKRQFGKFTITQLP